MKTAVSMLLLILFFYIGSSFCDPIPPLDYNTFRTFLDEAYSKTPGADEKSFEKHIWPIISSNLIPDSVVIPAEEYAPGDDHYICATETKIYPKLADPTTAKLIKLQLNSDEDSSGVSAIKNHHNIAVYAKFEFTKPLSFDLTEKGSTQDTSIAMTPVRCTFPGDLNILQIILAYPDFSKIKKDSVTRDCLVYVNSVSIKELNKAVEDEEIQENDEERDMALRYKNLITDDDYKMLFTVGIVRAVRKRLETKSWICAHDNFEKQDDKYEDGNWVYSDSYKQYCNGKRAE